MKLKHIPQLLELAFHTKTSIELVSGPGIGKSSVVRQFVQQLSKKLGEPVGLITEFLSTMEGVDVRGFPTMTEVARPDGKPGTVRQAEFSLPPMFPSLTLFPEGIPRYGIIFLDEFGQGSTDVTRAAARLIDERRMGAYSLDAYGHWTVFMASNRMTDRSAVQKQPMFVQNRKATVPVDPDLDSWVMWADDNDIHHNGVSFARSHPGLIFPDAVPKEDGPFPSPRTFVRAINAMAKQASLTGITDGSLAMDPVSRAMTAGLIGMPATVELFAHISMADALTTYEEVVADPKGAKVPDASKPDARYAVCQMLAQLVKPEDGLKVFRYLQRFPKEYQVSTLRSAMRRTPALLHHAEFTAWLQENQSLLLAVSDAERA